jgi:hypothetical protein
VFDFIAFMTNKMKMIRAFSFFFVDVVLTIFRFLFVIEQVFIISFFYFFFDSCFTTFWSLMNDCQTLFERRLFSLCYSSNDSSKLSIFSWWWINSDNSLTQLVASIWAWWINELYAVFQCMKSINSRDYLKKRRKLASIVLFLFCVRKKLRMMKITINRILD